MIIAPEKRAIILDKEEIPRDLLNVVPVYRNLVDKDGHPFIALPHKMDETRLLRNVGITVPSPVLHYYDWPRSPRIPHPFEAQRETTAFLTLHPRAHVHNGLGSGKTLASLWAFDYLRSIGSAKKALIIATLSTLEPAWGDSIEEHLPHLQYRVLWGSKKKRKKLLEDQLADIYITNFDGAVILMPELRDRTDIDVVILDEIADAARNMRTQRWRSFDCIINGASYKEQKDGGMRRSATHDRKRVAWGLTATPMPNLPTDAYAQAKLIAPDQTPMRFTQFRDEVMFRESTFTWVSKADAPEKVFKLLKPSIRFSREECIDLPPTTYTNRFVPLTKNQDAAYRDMVAKYAVETADGMVTAANEGVKMAKLVQIACGSAYTACGGTANFNVKPRLEETLSVVHASQSKTLVFVPFISAVSTVHAYLSANGVRAEMIHGSVGKSERDRIFGEFQHTEDLRVIVAQPAAMAHGLTLVKASTILWYAPTTRADVYEQANGRITRPGQKYNTLIVHIWGTAIEKRMYQRLQTKQSMQGILLDMIKEGRSAD